VETYVTARNAANDENGKIVVEDGKLATNSIVMRVLLRKRKLHLE
jgi:hypothetical protein